MKFIGRLLKFVIQSFIQPFITNPNKIITDRPFIGKTHALIWAVKKSCDANFYITYVDLVFASLITEATLNYTLEEGPDKGKSVAYFLARSGEGRALLAYDNHALGKLIINRAERSPGFEAGPRYFEDPEILQQFMLKFPDRRGEIKSEAPSHVKRLKDYLPLTTTCKSLNLKNREIEAAKVQSQQSANERADMNQNSLDSREQEVIISLSGLRLFPEVSSDASATQHQSLSPN